jgi:hypothetical protein
MRDCGSHRAAEPGPNPARSFRPERNDLTFFVELKQNGFRRWAQRFAAVNCVTPN